MLYRPVEGHAAVLTWNIRRHVSSASECEPIVQMIERITSLARELPRAFVGALEVEESLERRLCDLVWRTGNMTEFGVLDAASQLQTLVTNLEAAHARCYTPRNADDVFRTENILHGRIGLPLPLVWQILEDAEYWVRSMGSCGHLKVTSHGDAVQEALCCTVKIPSYVKDHRPLRRIVFKIHSHHQGWRDDAYPQDDSWTWFEAGGEAADRRVVVHDVFTSRSRDCTHRIQWDLTSPDDTEGSNPSSQLDEWMRCFTRGQELSVFALARHVDWRDHVDQVVVEVYCACV